MDNFIPVIMAGGQGKRFWPLSTADRPKQFIDLERKGRTLLQATWDRLVPLVKKPSQIMVATSARYVDLVISQLPEMERENLIVEPIARDSGPAIAYVCLEVERRFGSVLVGIFPSDHHIGDPIEFRRVLGEAIHAAEETDGLVTLGITPDRPATGYGYIERGTAASKSFAVTRFIEKPNLAQAAKYIESGKYLWNAGIFVAKTQVLLGELHKHAPEIIVPLSQALDDHAVAEIFLTLPNISIDYAVMEKTSRAYVIPADPQWDDIGDWIALERHWKDQEDCQNTVFGRHIGQDAVANIIYLEDANDVVVTLGIENIVLVKRENIMLLVHRDRVQELRNLIDDDDIRKLQ